MIEVKQKIYLAGGFKGGWHKYVTEKLGNGFIYFDPQKHQLDESDKYTAWDLYHVDKCDILLGYMTEENPSGYGLALEIGFAKAKNKLIILIDERSKKDKTFKRYFSICHESATIIFNDLDEAIQYLKTF
jgi:nucleoside 2-deoxyribosyltransferase